MRSVPGFREINSLVKVILIFPMNSSMLQGYYVYLMLKFVSECLYQHKVHGSTSTYDKAMYFYSITSLYLVL